MASDSEGEGEARCAAVCLAGYVTLSCVHTYVITSVTPHNTLIIIIIIINQCIVSP